MARGKFTGFADIHHHCFFAVNQLDCSVGVERARAHAACNQGPDEHAARGKGNRNQHPVVNQKFHVVPLYVFSFQR